MSWVAPLALPVLCALSFALQRFRSASPPERPPTAPVASECATGLRIHPAHYEKDPAFNPRGLLLSDSESTRLATLLTECSEDLRQATAAMHQHALEWARIRIDLGQAERIHSTSANAPLHLPELRSARAPEEGALVGITKGDSLWSVTILPGEDAAFDLSMADRKEAAESCRDRIIRFFAEL